MKIRFFLFIFALFTVNASWGASFQFMNFDRNKILKDTINEYNKNLNLSSLDRLQMSKAERVEYKNYLNKYSIKKLPKADLIGNTIYFKNGQDTLRMNIVKFESFDKIILQVQGHEVIFDKSLGLKINIKRIAAATRQTQAWWEILFGLQQVHAEDDFLDLEPKFKKQIFAISSFTFFASSILRERTANVCNAENMPVPGDDLALKVEIQDLVSFQEQFVTPTVKNNKNCQMGRGDEAILGDNPCPVADLETCIDRLANVRFEKLRDKYQVGYPCAQKSVGSEAWYLLNPSLKSDEPIDYYRGMETDCNSTANTTGVNPSSSDTAQ